MTCNRLGVVLCLPMMLAFWGCAAEEAGTGQVNLVGVGDTSSDEIRPGQVVRPTFRDIVYVTDGQYDGTTTVTHASEALLAADGELVVIRPGSERWAHLRVAPRGLVDSWNADVRFELFVRINGADWQWIEIPVAEEDQLAVDVLFGDVFSFLDYALIDFENETLSYHSYAHTLGNISGATTIQFPGISQATVDFGVFVFPVSTRLGDLEGTFGYSVEAMCSGEPCHSTEAGPISPLQVPEGGSQECFVDMLRSYDASGQLVGAYNCWAEQRMPCVESEVNGEPLAECTVLCGGALEGTSWCGQDNRTLQSCDGLEYAAELCMNGCDEDPSGNASCRL